MWGKEITEIRFFSSCLHLSTLFIVDLLITLLCCLSANALKVFCNVEENKSCKEVCSATCSSFLVLMVNLRHLAFKASSPISEWPTVV